MRAVSTKASNPVLGFMWSKPFIKLSLVKISSTVPSLVLAVAVGSMFRFVSLELVSSYPAVSFLCSPCVTPPLSSCDWLLARGICCEESDGSVSTVCHPLSNHPSLQYDDFSVTSRRVDRPCHVRAPRAYLVVFSPSCTVPRSCFASLAVASAKGDPDAGDHSCRGNCLQASWSGLRYLRDSRSCNSNICNKLEIALGLSGQRRQRDVFCIYNTTSNTRTPSCRTPR
jgi:hypothetical protein